MDIRIAELANSNALWGSERGREVQGMIRDQMDAQPNDRMICISLKGVLMMDATFFREAVVLLVKQHLGEKGFCLKDVENADVLSNARYAAGFGHKTKNQPITVWLEDSVEFIGRFEPDQLIETAYDVIRVGEMTSSKLAADRGISISLASMKLKQLADRGYLLRETRSAETGGIEGVFLAIR